VLLKILLDAIILANNGKRSWCMFGLVYLEDISTYQLGWLESFGK